MFKIKWINFSDNEKTSQKKTLVGPASELNSIEDPPKTDPGEISNGILSDGSLNLQVNIYLFKKKGVKWLKKIDTNT